MPSPYPKKSHLNKTITILITLALFTTTFSTMVNSKNLSIQPLINEQKKPNITIENKTSNIPYISINTTDEKNPINSKQYTEENTNFNLIKRFSSKIRNDDFQILPLQIVTNLNGNIKTTKTKFLTPTTVDVDDDGDEDIKVWIFSRPSIDIKSFSLCLKTTIKITRLSGMNDIKKTHFEVFIQYTPKILSRLFGISNQIRLGYQSPEHEEIPDKFTITHTLIPHLLSIKEKPEYRISIDPGNAAGTAKLNLIVSLANVKNENISSRSFIKISYNPAIKTDLLYRRIGNIFSKKWHFELKRNPTPSQINFTYIQEEGINRSIASLSLENAASVEFNLELTPLSPAVSGIFEFKRDSSEPVHATFYIKDFSNISKGSFRINNLPQQITASWLLSIPGYIEINTYGTNDMGNITATVNDIVTLSFMPQTDLDLRISWNNISFEEKKFELKFDASIYLEVIDLSLILHNYNNETLQTEDYTVITDGVIHIQGMFSLFADISFDKSAKKDTISHVDFQNSTILLTMIDSNIYFHADDVLGFGEFNLDLYVSNTVSISLIDYNPEPDPDEPEFIWQNATILIDAKNGVLQLNNLDIENMSDFGHVFMNNITGHGTAEIYIYGYLPYIIKPLKIINEPGTSLKVEEFSFMFYGIPVALYDTEFIEGTAEIYVNMTLSDVILLNIVDADNVESFGLRIGYREGWDLMDLFGKPVLPYVFLYFDKPVLPFNFKIHVFSIGPWNDPNWNPTQEEFENLYLGPSGFNWALNAYALLDTKNMSQSSSIGVCAPNDKIGFRFNGSSLQADEFCLMWNLSEYKNSSEIPSVYDLITSLSVDGYLKLGNTGEIWICANGEWALLNQSGSGFFVNITQGHIQIGGNKTFSFNETFHDIDGKDLTIGGTFSLTTNDDIIDIWLNKTGITISGTSDFTITDFYLKYGENITINIGYLDFRMGLDASGGVTIEPTFGGNGIINATNVSLIINNAYIRLIGELPEFNQPPSISITNPSDNSYVQGTITVSGTAFDEDGMVEKVTISIEDTLLVEITEETISWSYQLDTTKFANGIYQLKATCTDNKGKSTSTNITIIVDNPGVNTRPDIYITYPVNNEIVQENITVTGTASDPDGDVIQYVQIKLDQGNWVNATGTTSWSYELDFGTRFGPHTIYARSFDGVNYSHVDSVTVIVKIEGGFFELNLINASINFSQLTFNITGKEENNIIFELHSFRLLSGGNVSIRLGEKQGCVRLENTASEIDFTLDLNVSIDETDIILQGEISLDAGGSASGSVELGWNESGVNLIDGDFEGEVECLLSVKNLLLDIENVGLVNADEIAIVGNGSFYFSGKEFEVDASIDSLLLDNLVVNSGIDNLSVSADINVSGDGSVYLLFVQNTTFNLSLDPSGILEISDFDLHYNNITVKADYILGSGSVDFNFSYDTINCSCVCFVSLHGFDIYNLYIAYDNLSAAVLELLFDGEFSFDLSTNIDIDVSDDSIYIVIGGGSFHVEVDALFTWNNTKGGVTGVFDFVNTGDTFEICLYNLSDSANLSVVVNGSAAVNIEEFHLWIEDILDVSIDVLSAGFTLNTSGKNGELLFSLDDSVAVFDVDVELDVVDLLNITLQCSIDAYVEGFASGVMELVWNESGVLFINGSINGNGIVNISIVDLLFISSSLALSADEVSVVGYGNISLNGNCIGIAAGVDSFVVDNLSISKMDNMFSLSGMFDLSAVGNIYLSMRNNTFNLSTDDSFDTVVNMYDVYVNFTGENHSIVVDADSVYVDASGSLLLSVSFHNDTLSDLEVCFNSSGSVSVENMYISIDDIDVYVGSFSFTGSFRFTTNINVNDGSIVIGGELHIEVDTTFVVNGINGGVSGVFDFASASDKVFINWSVNESTDDVESFSVDGAAGFSINEFSFWYGPYINLSVSSVVGNISLLNTGKTGEFSIEVDDLFVDVDVDVYTGDIEGENFVLQGTFDIDIEGALTGTFYVSWDVADENSSNWDVEISSEIEGNGLANISVSDFMLIAGNLSVEADAFVFVGNGSISLSEGNLDVDVSMDQLLLDDLMVNVCSDSFSISGNMDLSGEGGLSISFMKDKSVSVSFSAGASIEISDFEFLFSNVSIIAGQITGSGSVDFLFELVDDGDDVNCTCNGSIYGFDIYGLILVYDEYSLVVPELIVDGGFSFVLTANSGGVNIDVGDDAVTIIIGGGGKIHFEVDAVFTWNGYIGGISGVIDVENTGDVFEVYLYNLSGIPNFIINGSAVVNVENLHVWIDEVVDISLSELSIGFTLNMIDQEGSLELYVTGVSVTFDVDAALDLNYDSIVLQGSFNISLSAQGSGSIIVKWNKTGITSLSGEVDADLDIDLKILDLYFRYDNTVEISADSILLDSDGNTSGSLIITSDLIRVSISGVLSINSLEITGLSLLGSLDSLAANGDVYLQITPNTVTIDALVSLDLEGLLLDSSAASISIGSLYGEGDVSAVIGGGLNYLSLDADISLSGNSINVQSGNKALTINSISAYLSISVYISSSVEVTASGDLSISGFYYTDGGSTLSVGSLSAGGVAYVYLGSYTQISASGGASITGLNLNTDSLIASIGSFVANGYVTLYMGNTFSVTASASLSIDSLSLHTYYSGNYITLTVGSIGASGSASVNFDDVVHVSASGVLTIHNTHFTGMGVTADLDQLYIPLSATLDIQNDEITVNGNGGISINGLTIDTSILYLSAGSLTLSGSGSGEITITDDGMEVTSGNANIDVLSLQGVEIQSSMIGLTLTGSISFSMSTIIILSDSMIHIGGEGSITLDIEYIYTEILGYRVDVIGIYTQGDYFTISGVISESEMLVKITVDSQITIQELYIPDLFGLDVMDLSGSGEITIGLNSNILILGVNGDFNLNLWNNLITISGDIQDIQIWDYMDILFGYFNNLRVSGIANRPSSLSLGEITFYLDSGPFFFSYSATDDYKTGSINVDVSSSLIIDFPMVNFELLEGHGEVTYDFSDVDMTDIGTGSFSISGSFNGILRIQGNSDAFIELSGAYGDISAAWDIDGDWSGYLCLSGIISAKGIKIVGQNNKGLYATGSIIAGDKCLEWDWDATDGTFKLLPGLPDWSRNFDWKWLKDGEWIKIWPPSTDPCVTLYINGKADNVVLEPEKDYQFTAFYIPENSNSTYTYKFVFGDGKQESIQTNETVVTVEHNYSQIGEYIARVEVTDDQFTFTDTANVTVRYNSLYISPSDIWLHYDDVDNGRLKTEFVVGNNADEESDHVIDWELVKEDPAEGIHWPDWINFDDVNPVQGTLNPQERQTIKIDTVLDDYHTNYGPDYPVIWNIDDHEEYAYLTISYSYGYLKVNPTKWEIIYTNVSDIETLRSVYIKNYGEQQVTVDVSTAHPDWDWSFDFKNSPDDSFPVSIPAHGTKILDISLVIPDNGTHEFNITFYNVDDPDEYAAISVSIVPDSMPPIADIGGPYYGIAGKSITFDATGSIDPDGSNHPIINPNGITKYYWKWGDQGENEEWHEMGRMCGPTPKHIYVSPGVYMVQLKVEDDEGDISDVVTTTVTVNESSIDVSPNHWLLGFVEPGSTLVSDPYTIENIGDTMLNWEVDTNNLPDWGTNWDFNPSSGSLQPGETTTMTISVVAPDDPWNITWFDEAVIIRNSNDSSDFDFITIVGSTDIYDYPPVAVLSNQPYVVEAGSPITFDASQSYDDGEITQYDWQWGDEWVPHWHILRGATPSHVYNQPGVYTVKVRVYDDYSPRQTNITSASVTVLEPDLYLSIINPDNDACINRYEWFDVDVVDQNGEPISAYIKFADKIPHYAPLGHTTFYANVEPGEYQIETWKVYGGYTGDSITVTVKESSTTPTADAGGPYVGYVGEVVSFDGSGSSDDGFIVSYEWDFGDGTSGSGETTTHTYTDTGIYIVSLSVTDNEGNIDEDTAVVLVRPDLHLNIIAPVSVDVNEKFDVTVTDQNGNKIAAWVNFDGDIRWLSNGVTIIPFTAPDIPGNYEITAWKLGYGSTSKNINVVENNDYEPIADAGGPYVGYVGEVVSFDGSGSSDDGFIVSYEWDFGDGTSGSGITTTHSYNTEGIYTLTLTVTDDDNNIDTDTTTVTIQESGVALSIVAPASVDENEFFDVSIVDDSNNPVYAWVSFNGITKYGHTVQFQAPDIEACCLPAGTLITMADGTVKPIEKIAPGDKILSYEIVTEKYTTTSVEDTIIKIRNGLYSINNELIMMTNDHPFYIQKPDGRKCWAAVDPRAAEDTYLQKTEKLEVGDRLLNIDGKWINIESIEHKPGEIKTYTFTVDKVHNYFANGILVHNGHQCVELSWIYRIIEAWKIGYGSTSKTIKILNSNYNNPPVLSNGYVAPSSGDTSTTFTYYVTYQDIDGDNPSIKNVYIDGTAHTMTKISGSPATGALYRYQTTLSEGDHVYYFYFKDMHGNSKRLPLTGVISGPTVSSNINPPVVYSHHTSDISDTSATLYGYLSDDGGEACTCYLTIDGVGTYNCGNGYHSGDYFSYTFTGLQPDTTYQWYATAYNSQGSNQGEIKHFTTKSAIQPPRVRNLQVVDKGADWVELKAQLYDDGGEACHCKLYIGGGPSWTEPGTHHAPHWFSHTFTGLQPGTTYTAYATVWNSKGGHTILKTFTTDTCFLAGTKITMADNSLKNIEDIVVGDIVKSYDEDKKEIVNDVVTEVFYHTKEEMGEYYLIINGKIRVTPNHPIFVNNEWIEAGKIKIGDRLKTINEEEIPVFSIEKIYEKASTYNFEVKTNHNYFAEGILVHNKSGGGSGPPGGGGGDNN